jgi:hypothetical protein
MLSSQEGPHFLRGEGALELAAQEIIPGAQLPQVRHAQRDRQSRPVVSHGQLAADHHPWLQRFVQQHADAAGGQVPHQPEAGSFRRVSAEYGAQGRLPADGAAAIG